MFVLQMKALVEHESEASHSLSPRILHILKMQLNLSTWRIPHSWHFSSIDLQAIRLGRSFSANRVETRVDRKSGEPGKQKSC